MRDYLAPVLHESKFQEHGRITPQEFVLAGDYLARHFPTWHWSAGESSKAREYLPADKQFLISKGVPCFRRVSTLTQKKRRSRLLSSPSSATSVARLPSGLCGEEQVLHDDQGDEKEDWVLTAPYWSGGGQHSPVGRRSLLADDGARELSMRLAHTALSDGPASHASSRRSSQYGVPHTEAEEMDDAEALSALGGGLQEKDDPAQFTPGLAPGNGAAPAARLANVMAVRTYDCMITYDKYYQTPRIWLVGYDENGLPLQPTQIFEDVASDYAFKTVTIEPFPHGTPGSQSVDTLLAARTDPVCSPRSLSVHVASIHPCKHASMMRKIIQRMNDSGQYREPSSPPSSPLPDPALRRSPWQSAVRRVWGSTQPAPPERDGVRVEQYLVLFLKFMASIVPTIEIDATHP